MVEARLKRRVMCRVSSPFGFFEWPGLRLPLERVLLDLARTVFGQVIGIDPKRVGEFDFMGRWFRGVEFSVEAYGFLAGLECLDRGVRPRPAGWRGC